MLVIMGDIATLIMFVMISIKILKMQEVITWNGKIMHGSPDTRSPADYYGDITFTSALAHAEWAKYAREVYGEQWKQVYQAALKRRLK